MQRKPNLWIAVVLGLVDSNNFQFTTTLEQPQQLHVSSVYLVKEQT